MTFYTYFLLKNWNSTQINEYLKYPNNISITSNITTAYNKTIVPYDNKDFDCSFSSLHYLGYDSKCLIIYEKLLKL